jgi:hypothetical protein
MKMEPQSENTVETQNSSNPRSLPSDRQRKRKGGRFIGDPLPTINLADDGCSELPTGMEL